MLMHDIVLLSAFVRQLQVMLLICSQYALNNELIFNSTKSCSMGFGKVVDFTNLPHLFEIHSRKQTLT